MATSDIKRSDVLEAIKFRNDPSNGEFIASLHFGQAQRYRLVYEGLFYESKEIAGIAHGIATDQFWNRADVHSGAGSGKAADILRRLGFLIDDSSQDGSLYELTAFNRYKHPQGGGRASYQYILLLSAISRARSEGQRSFRFSEVEGQVDELLKPFAVSKSKPEAHYPWDALNRTSWWVANAAAEIAGTDTNDDEVDEEDGVEEVDGVEAWEEPEGGLARGVYERLTKDDTFTGATVDVITRIIQDEPGFNVSAYKELLERLELANLMSFEIGASKSSGQPMHLLFRWDPNRNRDTIADHRTVADSQGFVWWGKVGDPSKTAMRQTKRQIIADQLESGTPTHVYLSGGGELWRTTLVALTTNQEDVDPALVPSYYSPATQHHLWLKLLQFEQLPPDWATRHLTLASTGAPLNFGGQSSLFYVHEDADMTAAPPSPADRPVAYTVDDIIADGCFHSRERLEHVLRHWEGKLNVVLQGAPGTGKTWLAKRLAYALIGARIPDAIRAVQFHPNTSYEDFVRGWRPTATDDGVGRLVLTDGPLLQHAKRAKDNPDTRHVLIIEEINRGNPSQAFGEMLTLIEATKRKPADALSLSYPRPADEQYYLPPNLFILGTMNIADRSLALVDFALRRRFSFETLEPAFTTAWEQQLHRQLPDDPDLVAHIRDKILALNDTISTDPALGPQFAVGHSFFTPAGVQSDGWEWFKGVVQTEIGPLLNEYWFDDRSNATDAVQRLLSRGLDFA